MSRRTNLTLCVMAAPLLLGSLAALWWLRDRGSAAPAHTVTPHFQERSRQAGIAFVQHYLPKEQGDVFKANLYDHGSGVAVGDYDGDGRDDIYFVNQLGANALYRNKGDGTFEDVTQKAGVGLGDRVCVAATFADYDNDGKQDLFVTSTRGGNVLFRNRGDGTFEDATEKAGVAHVGHSQVAVFFDFDNDGFLDLFVANTAAWTLNNLDASGKYYIGRPDPEGKYGTMWDAPVEANILYRNNGNGTFTDVTARAGLRGRGWSADVAVFDYNADGWLDVLVTSMYGRSQLYRNNGNGAFDDVALTVLGKTPWGGMGANVFDFNNDGILDLYMVDMHSDMWIGKDSQIPANLEMLKKGEHTKYPSIGGPPYRFDDKGQRMEAPVLEFWKIDKKEVVFGNTLFKGLGQGKFEEISDPANMENFWPWGVAPGDFDNDGYEDVFVPAGMGHPYVYWPNYLLMNNGNETFTDRAEAEGIEPPERGRYREDPKDWIWDKPTARSSRSAAVADFDGDGRLDIVVNNFNDAPYFFKNSFPQANYVAFRLRGTKSNRDAIGAVVRLHAGNQVMTRLVHPASGYLAQSSKTVHFGLGDRTRIDKVEIVWPSGIRQTLDRFETGRVHDVTESAPAR